MASIKLKKMVSLPQKKIHCRIIMSFQDFSFLASCTCIYSVVQTINVFKLQRKELPVEINLVYFFFDSCLYNLCWSKSRYSALFWLTFTFNKNKTILLIGSNWYHCNTVLQCVSILKILTVYESSKMHMNDRLSHLIFL